MSSIRLNNVKKAYGATEVIHGVDLDISEGEFVVFVGPSGCGKSTLLRLISGLEDITDGDLYIGDERVNDYRPKERGIAMVFQSYALYPHMTVYKNMAFGLKLGKTDKAEIDRRVRETAKILQLDKLLDRRPSELSGGQRQRVAIGRAIVRQPKVFLFDEPLSNLDAALRVQTRIEIANLHEELKTTIIYVTHDQVEAMTLADKIVVLNGGNVEQVGAPLELYNSPRNLFVAGFIGSPSMNFIKGEITLISDTGVTVTAGGGSAVTLPLKPGKATVGEAVTIGVRPEHMNEGADGDFHLTGRVDVVERLGDVSYVYFHLPDTERLTMSVPFTSAAKKGEAIAVSAASADIHLFDEQGQALERLP
ncbi:ABC transporter ATP-binding protein [Aestuariispira insulae]|uniref:Multiple sugar transport system ATP-binding protein/multiple sugar transport system ATP-binding protein n=1 Tax=Aestuariispira insulae TaxID=1461337 RepID=A0A3D9HQ69_9PROT|nr:sn-glycerol-3-phosphate ABC transporter ATP-binding protein UgpC [Aestuariispira insulae]RED51599.1 multiple sugar transport system ATP-binding protein/multiple sugar transport system ATP-binding protein [Aestuariispira insulae]